MISQQQSIKNMHLWSVYNTPMPITNPLTILSAADSSAELKNENVKDVLKNLLL